ncbi:hypothetical protein [Eubacterium sp.]
MEEKKLILLTGTIDPSFFKDKKSGEGVNVVFANAEQRFLQYSEVIERFIKESAFEYIVFAENTDFPFEAEKYEKMASLYNKKFEFLRCNLNENEILQMRKKGKSFGEGRLISYAIENSKLISKVETIYKITGRVFLENSKLVVANGEKNRNQFIVKNKIGWANTEFFKVNVDDFKNYFLGKESLTDDFAEKSIERVYYSLVKDNKLECKGFRVYPKLHGRVASATNRNYDKSTVSLLLCNIASWLGIFDLK